MPAVTPTPPPADEHHLVRRFWKTAMAAWTSRRYVAGGLVLALVVIMLLQLLMQFLLNLWNRNFFDALEQRDARTILTQAELFVPLAAASVLLSGAAVWGRMTAQRYWRQALSTLVINSWLKNGRFRKIDEHVKGTENPEYRIAIDVRTATDSPVDLAVALFTSVITAITFFGVLWEIGGSIDVQIDGATFTIPAYLVLGVIVYSATMTGSMLFIGHRLTGIIEHMSQAEAEYRAAADAFRQNNHHADDIPDADKERTLWQRLAEVIARWRALCLQLSSITLISQGNLVLAPVIAWFLCAPKYLNDTMTLGELTQTAAAFVTVQSAFNWLVDNYQRLSDWRASAHRVATLLIALDKVEAEEKAE
jgi:ABC-type uncharacterized transport system fused permease/ATPase subunit